MALEIHPHHPSFVPPSREVFAYQRRQRLRRWSIVVALAMFLAVTSSSVIVDISDHSAVWSQWVISGAAAIAAIHAVLIERPRLHSWLLQRRFNQPSYEGKTDAR